MFDVDDGPEALLQEARRSHAAFHAALGDLSGEEMLQPGMTGRWSGKDTLAHIARWDDATADLLRTYLCDGVDRGGEYDDYKAWNARWEAEDRDLALTEARSRFAGAHGDVARVV